MGFRKVLWASVTLPALMSVATVSTGLADTLFWSTQAAPIESAQAVREKVLAGFSGKVDFQSMEVGPFMTRLDAEMEAGKGAIGVVGGLHGELATYEGKWTDISDIDLAGANLSAAFIELGKLGTGEQQYLPWMQANYVMAANKQALEFLPDGADLNALTYDQLVAWAKTLAENTGSPKFGFPAGPKGLKHRFFQGFMLPSYAHSTVTKFASPEAEAGWSMFKELWAYTNPASTNYGFMQEPLLTNEVWVAFDHVARLSDAFNQRPDDFVAFPAPSGPKGRGFMPVLAGIAVPAGAPNIEEAKAVVQYMLSPEAQVAVLREIAFFPVTDVALPSDLPASAQALGNAITAMTSSADALPALLPVGLGDMSGQFNQVYTDTFERIALGNQPIREVLDQQVNVLRDIIEQTKAPCWLPDEPSEGPCPID